MKCYKIVRVKKRKNGERYFSFWAGDGAKVEYKIGEYVGTPDWLKKQGYYLTVFENIKTLKQYAKKRNLEPELFRYFICDCEEKVNLPRIAGYVDYIKHGILVLSKYHAEWPRGTRMFKKVKLIKEIEL